MEILTKENFFNELQEKYPAAVDLFYKWIDEYKKRVKWDHLFATNMRITLGWRDGIKFHEIPIEMQVGIIMKFFTETSETEVNFLKDCSEEITEWFKELNDKK